MELLATNTGRNTRAQRRERGKREAEQAEVRAEKGNSTNAGDDDALMQ